MAAINTQKLPHVGDVVKRTIIEDGLVTIEFESGVEFYGHISNNYDIVFVRKQNIEACTEPQVGTLPYAVPEYELNVISSQPNAFGKIIKAIGDANETGE